MVKAASLHISAQDALKSQTLLVTITGKRRLGLRIAMGVRLIKLAARVIGCKVEVRGPFASGGEVRSGRRYVVGDNDARGVEGFIPTGSGKIVLPVEMLKPSGVYTVYPK